MSYINIIYGDIKPFSFNSRDPITDDELRLYLNEIFVKNDIFNFIKDINIGYYILIGIIVKRLLILNGRYI